MRKKLLLFLSFMLSLWSYGQFTFPNVTGPISVSGGTAENVLINDAANAAAVPAGLYDSFSVSVDWESTNNAWASEADLTINTSGGSVTIDPPTTGSANSGAATTLTFSGSLTSLYDPSVDGLLTLDLNQSYPSSDANWSNIVVTLFEAPTCPSPTALLATGLSEITADIAWTAGASEGAWNISWGTPGYTPGDGNEINTVTVTSASYQITGLTANTDYDIYIQADCGGGDQSAWSGPLSIYTGYCAVSSGSEYLTSITSSGAITDISYSATSQPAGSYADETVQVIEAYESLTFDVSTVYSTGSNGVNIWVDWNNNFTFEASELVASLANSSTAKTLSVTVPPGTAQGDYRMRVRGQWGSTANPPACGNVSYGSTVDFTVTITATPSCLPTTDLVASNPTQTTVDLAWSENNSATTWNIEYGPEGFVPGTGTVISGVTTNPYTVSGLNPSSTYDFYVQSDCGGGDESAMGGFATESTECAATNVPYLQDFESATAPNIPTCTSIENTGIGNDWKTKSSATTGFTGNVLNYSFHPSSPTGPANTWFFTQGINLVAGVSYTISYKYGNNSTFYTESMKVAYGTTADEVGMTNALTDHPAIQISTPADESLVFTVAADDVYYFGFNVYSIQNQNQLYLDDIEIYETPTCFPPSDLMVSNLTSTSVDLTWTENNSATTWNVEFGPAGFTPGTGTEETATTNPHTITITPDTDYEFYVQSDCGGGDLSTWVGPFAFSNTYCTPQATNASRYIDDFSTTNGVQDVTNNGTGFSVDGYGDFTAQQISQTLGQTIDFSTTIVGGNAGFRVWIDWDNDFQFDASDVVYQSSTYLSTHTGTITVPAGTTPGPKRMRIVSHWLSTTGAIDPCETGFTYGEFEDYTFEVLPAPPCLDPTDFVASNMTGSTVDLSWTANGTATEWNIEYGANGFTQGTGTTETGVTANPYTLTGLTQGTDYDVYIQSDCGVNQGTWVGPLSFSTTTCTPTTGDTTAVACDSFDWFGTTYTASGTATHVLTNSAGCDSTVTLTLTINTSATGTDTQTACGSFTWIDGVEYTASNNTAMYTIVGGAANGCDSIVTLDLTINPVATGTDTQTACGSFTWIDGVEYTASNNTAMHTIVGGAANGCDSIVTLNLTVDTEVSAGNDNAITVCKGEQVDLDTLLSADADAGGTWYNSMNTPLASSVILSSFTAGNYDYTYEVVGSGACPDQTAVITVTVDGGCTADVNEEILGNISVYPNPTTSVLNIVNPSNTSSLRIEMLDMKGRVVMVENSALNNATEATLTIDHLEKGIYTLRVYNNEGHKTFKIVKQ